MSSFFSNDITEQYLMKLYDDLEREKSKIMNDMKTTETDNHKKYKELSKQVSCISSLTVNVIKLKQLKNKLQTSDL